jgi:hypothetical protein
VRLALVMMNVLSKSGEITLPIYGLTLRVLGNDKVRGLHERTTNKQQMTNLIVLTFLVHFNISREIMIMLQLFFVQNKGKS